MNGNKWTVTTFYTTPHMPTYLAAFVICDYDHVNRTERGKEVSKEDSPGKGTFVLAADCSSTLSASRGYGCLSHHHLLVLAPTFPSFFKALCVALRNEIQQFPL